MKTAPVNEKRLADLINQYGRPAELLLSGTPDSERPWQPDSSREPAKAMITILINDIAGLGAAELPDQMAEATGLVVMTPAQTASARRGALLTMDGQYWQIRQAAVLSHQKKRNILHLFIVQSNGRDQ